MKTMLTAAILGIRRFLPWPRRAPNETDPRKQEVLNKLNTMRVTVDFTNTTLEEAISYLRDFTSINIIVDAEVYKSQSEDQLKVTLKVKDLLLKSVLKLDADVPRADRDVQGRRRADRAQGQDRQGRARSSSTTSATCS